MSSTNLISVAPKQRADLVRRGLTLIEVLIVIALIGAVFALVLPSVDGIRRARSVSAVADRVEAIVHAARTHAERGGKTTAVAWVESERQLMTYESNSEDAFPTRRVLLDWSTETIPPSIAFLFESPFADFDRRITEDPIALGDAPGDAPSGAPSESPNVIAIFLPDGTPLVSKSVWLAPDDDRERDVKRLDLDSWSGVVRQRDEFPPDPLDPDADGMGDATTDDAASGARGRTR